ncbi:Zinc finger, CCHC-type [Trema orientale]|uniref:Zinc finger, CCHC-type n=1 Tax=Trema orientale TaxID=63057 RepID=A0A2P5EIJ8_TREOI|nr:Zinc finger, CCHC-type [Trema orientale]
MPATAGRVRMPANNRVHSSAALQTHGIWQSAIGYDPYAPNKEEDKSSTLQKSTNSDPEGENSYVNFQGLLALARITGSNNDEARGACKRCGRVGHLSFQCRNFLSMKDENKEKDPAAIQADVMSELDKLKGKTGKVNGKGGAESEDSENEDEESESSDPGYDSEIERIIAERTGKKVSRRDRSIKKKLDDDDDDDSSDSDSGKRKKRGRSKKKRSGKRESDDSDSSDDGRRKRRKEKRRKKDESADEEAERRRRRHRKSRKEKRRRRSHHHSDDSASDSSEDNRHRKRKSRRSPSPSPSHSDASDSDDAPRGRRDVKRSEKKSRKRHHDDE